MMRERDGERLLPATCPPYFLWHMIGLWLGDGAAKETSVAVADDEPEILEKVREFANLIGAEITVYPAHDGGRCSRVYIRNPRSNYFGRALVSLELMPGKEITTKTLAILLAQPRSCRLHFLAGLTDSDGTNAFEDVFGMHAFQLVQSVGRTATTHASILTAYAVVAQSLGMDARRSECFVLAHEVAKDAFGQVVRGDMNHAERVYKKRNYERQLQGVVLISGPATNEIPLWVTKKRLRQAQRFGDHSRGFDAMNAIPATSIGVYELKRLHSPLAMVWLEFCEDDDARGPDVFALPENGFMVLA